MRFSDFPFDEWAKKQEKPGIKWDVHILPAELSVHQRLMQRVEVVVPGIELLKRMGRGDLVVLLRLRDSTKHDWRVGNKLILSKVQPGVKSQEITFTLAAFVRPGQYTAEVAMVDTGNNDHDFTRRTFTVAPLKNDPLPNAWSALPPVEVIEPTDGPDSWYFPGINTIRLPSGPDPARVDILINMTPSVRFAGSVSVMRRNMAAVIPVMKVLRALNTATGRPSVTVLDLTHQKVAFEAPAGPPMSWRLLSSALNANDPNVIDTKSLSRQATMRDYFAQEVARRAGQSGPRRYLIVLSGPLTFPQQEETPLPSLPPDPNRHILFLRLSLAGPGRGPGGPAGPGLPPDAASPTDSGLGPDIRLMPPQRIRGPMMGRGAMSLPGRGGPPGPFADGLESVMKVMGAQTAPVSSPEIFRKILAALAQEVGGAAASPVSSLPSR